MLKVEKDEEEGSRMPILSAEDGTKYMRPLGPRTPPLYFQSEEMEEEMSKVEKDEEEGSRMPMLSA